MTWIEGAIEVTGLSRKENEPPCNKAVGYQMQLIIRLTKPSFIRRFCWRVSSFVDHKSNILLPSVHQTVSNSQHFGDFGPGGIG